jgi:hypothetical protein
MGLSGHTNHRVDQVVLPSGRTIEVHYFGRSQSRRSEPAEQPRELNVCPECSSGLVYPTNWAEAGPNRWAVELRCPECEWSEQGVHGETAVERFDRQLDLGTEAILDDLQKLTRTNMEDEIERFVKALEADLLLPEDF